MGRVGVMTNKDNIIEFLKHVGNDCGDDNYKNYWIECSMSKFKDTCPKHQNCGICRYEYMKSMGWLGEIKR